MKPYTFEDMWENLKNENEESKEFFSAAEMLANIVREISEARIKAGLTQAQLAEKCGMKQSAIARFENLSVMPKLDTVVKIAASLGLNIGVKNHPDKPTIIYMDQSAYTSKSSYSWQSLTNMRKENAYECVG